MEDLPQLTAEQHIAVTIPAPAYFQDHRLQDRVVLPAVEAMEILAESIQKVVAGVPVDHLTAIHFDKFLTIPKETRQFDARVDVQCRADGTLTAALSTRFVAPRSGITRTIQHARLELCRDPDSIVPPPMDVAAGLTGVCHSLPPETIYRELVPFGPAYQNIVSPLRLSADGALADICCPVQASTPPNPRLGCPFILDAAFHAACVWGQRYAGMVAFPVAMDQRVIFRATRPETPYVARILPKSMDLAATETAALVFDIWIYNTRGQLCEAVLGVRMQVISRGSWHPPQWITAPLPKNDLPYLRPVCPDLVLLELAAVAPFAQRALSAAESVRWQKMGTRRRQSYVAARLALKRLGRPRLPEGSKVAADEIETTGPLDHKPRIHRHTDLAPYCSVSHDHRFAVAACGNQPLGVDVEPLSDRAARCAHIFMHTSEKTLIGHHPLGPDAAALRVWSLKESAAKALGLPLAEAWQQVTVTVIGQHHSRFQISDQGPMSAHHDQIDQHLLTLFQQSASGNQK